MLDSIFKPEYSSSKGGFTLELPICNDWDQKKNRMLIVIETVDGFDLKARKLLSDRSRIVVKNLLKHAKREAKREDDNIPEFAYAAANFNDSKTFTLEPNQKRYFNKKFAERLTSIIAQLKPTHILVSGDAAFSYMFPDVENSAFKRGWVFNKKIGGCEVKVVPTIDLEPLYSNRQNKQIVEEDEGEDVQHDLYGKSNLLGFVIRNATNLYLGRHLYSLKHIKPNPRYVDSIDKFDTLMGRLNEAPIFAWDTEGKNLSQLNNKIYVMQFALTEDKGYVVPFYHPKTPWSPKQLKYIHKEFDHFFRQPPPEHFKYLIGMNAGFDLRVTRAEFGLPLIFRRVWDIPAGESCLDENIKYLADFSFDGVKTKSGNLRAIFTSYRNDFYFTAPFSKEDRGNIGQFPPDSKDVLEYESMDVQSLIGLHSMQLQRSERLSIGDKSYRPYYRRFVSKQMSNMIHAQSHMEARGVNVDKLYLAYLKSKESPLLEILDENKQELYKSKTVKKANKILLRNEGVQVKGGIFKNRSPWLFDIGKPVHQRILFFDVMDMEPVGYTKKSKEPSTDKWFQLKYKGEVPEVAAFERVQKVTKLWGTYVKGWWNIMKESMDSIIDNRLRPAYGFFNVVTGRTNSFHPNLQQVPTRDALSKHIKRMFLAPKGKLGVKFDYSAHEVRVWSIISGDMVLAAVFKAARKLRRKYRLRPSEKYRDLLKKKGDIHILNVHFFFGKWVDKNHWLRDAIKSVVFGVIYGKGPKALSRDIKKTKEYAQMLIDKLFDRFVAGAKWLNWAKNFAEENAYIYAPTGRRRNLYGILTGIQAILSAIGRRGMNSPIQGMASDIAITSIRLIQIEFYRYMKKWHDIEGMKVLPAEVMKFVHDALYSEVPYEHLLPFLHILQYTATFGVTKWYKEEFGLDFTVEPEIELEIGASEDAYAKWDWTEDNLKQIIRKGLEDQQELGVLKENIDDTLKLIYKPYKNAELKAWLDEKYPILGIRPK